MSLKNNTRAESESDGLLEHISVILYEAPYFLIPTP